MGKNNYPQAGLDEIPAEDIQKILLSLKELHDLGRPETDFEVEDRIDKYFSFCIGAGLRPGIEGLGLALHVSRTTLFNWERGINCSLYRQEIIQRAKSYLAAFLEQTVLCGKISPPSGIFLMKNWLGYRDAAPEMTAENKERRVLSIEELPKLGEKEVLKDGKKED